jgi:hypothetical protein
VSESGGSKLGIEVWGGCEHCVIEDNLIDHWLSVGGCDWCAVRRNVVRADDGTFCPFGIEAIGSYLVVTDNIVDGGQYLGLSVSGPMPKRFHYYGNNDFLHSTQWAVQLQGEKGGIAGFYFYRCKFNDTTVGVGKLWYPGDEGHGFRVNGNTRHMVLDYCQMSGNGRCGIQVTQHGHDFWSFQQCAIEGNDGAAMTAYEATDALEWIDCTVRENGSDTLPDAIAFSTPPPTVAISGPETAAVGEAVRLSATAAPGSGEIIQTLWDLGAGPPVDGNAAEYAYSEPGEYLITLIVWDTAGRAARAEHRLTIAEATRPTE